MFRHGLLDTSVVIDLDQIDDAHLPEQSTVSAITLAELTVGPLAAGRDEEERARRQDRLQWAAATWDPLPCDALAARAYGRIYSALVARGRTGRGRFADLLIAATALANDLPLYPRHAADVKGRDDLITIRAV